MRRFNFLIVAGLFVLSIISINAFTATPSKALSVGSASRECDNNAVLRCGALTTNELKTKYRQQNAGVIFNHFGISKRDINAMGSKAVAGHVTKSGQVKVNGKVVATNAMTAGRQNMPGSKAVSSGGQTFYIRPPSASFQSQSIPAFVVMKNGRFQHAVIAPCGNPVKAKPVVKKAVKKERVAKPIEQEVRPVEREKVVVEKKKEITQTVVVTPPPPPPPAPPAPTKIIVKETPPAPAPQPTKLPAAGTEDIISVAAFAAIAAGVFHNLHQRRAFRSK